MLLFLHGFSSNFITTTILHLQESTVNVVMIIISLFAKLKLQYFITSNGMDQLHVRPKKINYSRLHMTSYPDCYSACSPWPTPIDFYGKVHQNRQFS